MPANKVKLTVCGSNYVISTTDSEEYVQSLAERLDKDMNELMNQSPSASVAASAVVVALNLGDIVTNNYMVVNKVTHTFRGDEHMMELDLIGGEFIA